MSTELAANNAVNMAVEDKRQLADLMSRVLKKDEHYGIIPGTSKPTLYKAGAEIIARVFNIHAEMDVTERELEGGHREYRVKCRMFRNTDMMAVGEGLGMCTSRESKYRYRKGAENPNIEDVYNTVLKIAKKRAYNDAVISSTGASDFFTTDLEDFIENDDGSTKIRKEKLASVVMIERLKKKEPDFAKIKEKCGLSADKWEEVLQEEAIRCLTTLK